MEIVLPVVGDAPVAPLLPMLGTEAAMEFLPQFMDGELG